MKETHDYDDIIDLPRPSSARPAMPRADRAAQFSPFAALTNYAAAIEETGRLTDRMTELSEDEKAILSAKLQMLDEHAAAHPEAAFTYFRPDPRKAGGAYVTVTGRVKQIDPVQRVVRLTGGESIPIDCIRSIESAHWAEGIAP